MKIIKVEIKQEMIDYLQRLHFELEAHQDVIQRIIEGHSADQNADILESAVFKKYSKNISEIKAEYELAKQEVTSVYVPDEYKGKDAKWNIDFQTRTMTIEVLKDEA